MSKSEDKFDKELSKLKSAGFSNGQIFSSLESFGLGLPNKLSLMEYIDEGHTFFSGSSLRSKVALAIYNSLDKDDQFTIQQYLDPEAFI